jgi:hypothetical protein
VFSRDSFKFGDHLRGENKLIQDVTRSNALYLSAAAQHKHPQLSKIFRWFQNLRPINMSARRPRFHATDPVFEPPSLAAIIDAQARDSQPSLFPDEQLTADNLLLAHFKLLLKGADIGIVDVRLDKSDADGVSRRPIQFRFELKHQSEVADAWLPLNEESKGTQTLFRIALIILRAIQTGGTLVVDELESSMHPTLAQQIVRQFNDPAINQRNSQLIFTTHDTNLLGTITGEPTLRRDQVWLTEKDSEGATVLYPLTDYKPRKEENLERGYLQGRFGAIPFLGTFRLTGE